jgi:hypothetical protein
MTNASGRSRGASATAGASAPSIVWRLCASSWLLLLVFGGGGAVAWLAFGILSLIGRRRSWGIFAVLYALAAIGVRLPDDPVGGIAEGTLYLVVLLHGLIINQAWLLLLWGRHENGLTLMGTPRAPRTRATTTPPRRRKAAIPQEAEALLGGGGTARSDYVDESVPEPAPRRRGLSRAQRRAQAATEARAQAAKTTPQAPGRSAPERPAPERSAAPAGATDLVDVNTANQRTLAKLPGLDRALAKAAIAERTKRGGFASLESFAASAGLQPHELVRLAGEAYCSPRPRANRSFGRRVDY